MPGAYRRIYLYSALSLSLIVAAVAAAAALALVLRGLGLGARDLTADDIRLTLSQVAALLVFGVPIGYVHLRLINGSMREASERAAGVRHFFLNLWVFVSLVIVIVGGMSIAMLLFGAGRGNEDRSIPIAAVAVGAAVAVVGWRWRRSTPAPPRWEIDAAVATLVVAIVIASFEANIAALAAGALWGGRQAPQPAFFQEGNLRVGIAGTIVSLAVWGIAARWLWPFRTAVARLRYLVVFYALGAVLTTSAVANEIAAIDVALRGQPRPALGQAWGELAPGLLWGVVHGAWLFLDRGRNGHPRIAMERILVALPALTGLGAAVGAAVVLWSALVDFVLVTGRTFEEPRDRFGSALGWLIVAVALYPAACSWLLRRTDPTSTVRRVTVFVIVGLTLVGSVVTGAIAVFSLFSLLSGAPDPGGHQHRFASFIGPSIVLAAVFAAHLLLYMRDGRAQRAAALTPATPAADPLMLLFEDVAAGRLAPSDAVRRARALGAR